MSSAQWPAKFGYKESLISTSSATARPMEPHSLAEGPAPTLFLGVMLQSASPMHRGWAIPMSRARSDGLTPHVSRPRLISLSATSPGWIRTFALKGLTILISHCLRRPCLAGTGILDWSSVRNFSISLTEHSSLPRARRVARRTTRILA